MSTEGHINFAKDVAD